MLGGNLLSYKTKITPALGYYLILMCIGNRRFAATRTWATYEWKSCFFCILHIIQCPFYLRKMTACHKWQIIFFHNCFMEITSWILYCNILHIRVYVNSIKWILLCKKLSYTSIENFITLKYTKTVQITSYILDAPLVFLSSLLRIKLFAFYQNKTFWRHASSIGLILFH